MRGKIFQIRQNVAIGLRKRWKNLEQLSQITSGKGLFRKTKLQHDTGVYISHFTPGIGNDSASVKQEG